MNRALLEAARGMSGVVVDDLYEKYPDFFIDVPREQAALRSADIVIFQHPLYWYSVPALLKEWMDLVLEYGFAYGKNGIALKGKRLLTATSTGGSTRAYTSHEDGRLTLSELLGPIEQTARLCGMTYLPPFVVHDAHNIAKSIELERIAADYCRLIAALRDETLSDSDWAGARYLNDCLAKLPQAV